VFGGRILSRGPPGYIRIANTWLTVNVGGGPTPDKPSVTLSVPARGWIEPAAGSISSSAQCPLYIVNITTNVGALGE
jgi:hypothetical protein